MTWRRDAGYPSPRCPVASSSVTVNAMCRLAEPTPNDREENFLDWLLQPNTISNEEVRDHWENQCRANAAAGGSICPVCGKYLALHGDEHEYDNYSMFT